MPPFWQQLRLDSCRIQQDRPGRWGFELGKSRIWSVTSADCASSITLTALCLKTMLFPSTLQKPFPSNKPCSIILSRFEPETANCRFWSEPLKPSKIFSRIQSGRSQTRKTSSFLASCRKKQFFFEKNKIAFSLSFSPSKQKKVSHFYEPAAFPEIIFEKFYCDKNLQVSKRREETFNVKTTFVLDEAGYFKTFLLDPDNSFLLKTKKKTLKA